MLPVWSREPHNAIELAQRSNSVSSERLKQLDSLDVWLCASRTGVAKPL